MDQSSTSDLVSTPGESSVSSGESSNSGGFKRKPCRMFNRRNYDPVGKENIDPNFFMFEIQSTPDSECSKNPKKGGKCRRSPLALAPRNRNAWQNERLR